MRIHNLEEFMGFTLERWPNSFWLKKKDEWLNTIETKQINPTK
jgi:hypothetical protein